MVVANPPTIKETEPAAVVSAEPTVVVASPPTVTEPAVVVPILPSLPVSVNPKISKRGRTRGRGEKPRQKPKQKENRQVYVIHSQSPLSVVINEIKSHIPEDLKQNQSDLIGPCRIVFSRKQETDRAICVFHREIFEEMKRKGLTVGRLWSDFKVVPFRVRESIMPEDGQRHLFMILPEQLTITDVKNQLENELKVLSNFGIVKPNSYQILIPFKSRESDDHVGKCFIIWENGITNEDIAVTRIILNDSRWTDSEGYSIEGRQGMKCCFWARISNPKNVKMSPADRSYTHNHREQRRNKIQHYSNKSESRNFGKRAGPRDTRTMKSPNKHHQSKKRTDNFKLVMPEVPQPAPRSTQQPVYQSLSAVSQPVSIRGPMPASGHVVSPSYDTDIQPTIKLITTPAPPNISPKATPPPEVISINATHLPGN